MRFLMLYVRSRSVPVSVAVIVGCAAALWALGLTTDDVGIRATLGLIAATTGVAATAVGLAGADVDLDRTAALQWPPLRFAHVVLAGAVVLGAVAATALAHGGWLARDAAGMTGLIALGAAILGATRAWLPCVMWTVPSLMYAAPLGENPTGPTYKIVLTWMIQPIGSTAAAITAITLGTAGALTYAFLGPRR
jgi:hypothetical protein